MGSGNWIKKLTSSKKGRGSSKKKNKGSSTRVKSNGFAWKSSSKKSTIFAKATCDSDGNRCVLGLPIEDVAATMIQTAFRAYWARKSLRRLKGIIKLQLLTQGDSVKGQSVSTMNHLHSWGKMQDQIKSRRLCMVVEGRLKQKKLENQLKLDTKLHDAESEWSCTAESMDEIVAKIYFREEATVKRERAMAYAFNHQWRANATLNQLMGSSELGKPNWGWSWRERWIAARPWESRISTTPKAGLATPKSKTGKTTNPLSSTPRKPSRQPALSYGKAAALSNSKVASPKPALPNGKLASPKPVVFNGKAASPRRTLSKVKVASPKPTLSNAKGSVKPRRLSYPPSVKPAGRTDIRAKTTDTKQELDPKKDQVLPTDSPK